jgi:signal transduction histidine kinase
MINDLLALSRVATMPDPFDPVDLGVVAREVVSDLETRIEQVGGQVILGDLPTVEASPLQMRQLLQNLMGNGLKFRRPDVAPIVEVASRPLPDGFVELTVRDNGIGFDEKYLHKIFAPFQRLHGRMAYEGTGIGLAICQKIAERHGGGITARSAPDEGATFVVTLPLEQAGEGREENTQTSVEGVAA